MPKQRPIALLPPLAGLDKKTSFQSQPPYTTPSCLNVRPQDTDGRRERIGTRPGIGKAFQEQLGSGNPIRLLDKVSFVASGVSSHTDTFPGTALDTTVWSESTPFSTTGIPLTNGNEAYCWGGEQRAVDRVAYTIDAANAYYILMTIGDQMPGTTTFTKTFRIFARMATSSPNVSTSGLEARLELTYTSMGDKVYSGGLYVNGTLLSSFASGSYTVAGYRTFEVMIDGDNITATLDSYALCTSVAISAHAGQTRVGFGIEESAGGITEAAAARVKDFTIWTYRAASDRKTYVVASANGQVYYDADGIMTAVGAADAVAADMPLMAAERGQKLYIANYSTTDAALVPKVYDPIAGTVSTWTATAGSLPTRCKLICRYRDRMVLAGDIVNPHMWYMSALSAPTDFDYSQLSAKNTGSAIYGTNADAKTVGEEITALIPFSDDYLIMGCSDSIWSLRGDPGYGGQFDALSRTVGMVGGFAHCQTPSGELVFLSKDGIYMLPPGSVQHPIPVSRGRLPNEMLNIDPINIQVTMAFDVEYSGIHIVLTALNAGQSTHYFMDWENKGFWPVQWPYTMEPYALKFVATPTLRGVLMGCRDGYIRRHDNLYIDDDGTEPDAYITYGPIRPGGSAFQEGIVKDLRCTLNPNQNAVKWTLQIGETPQGVVSLPVAQMTGSFDAVSTHGLSFNQVMRVRGGGVAVKIESGDNGLPWSVEELGLTIMPTGRLRRI